MSPFFIKCRNAPWLVFAFVLAWKLCLFLLSAQPVPSNDAFFYDGAVVNQIRGGGYINPSLALALPISGAKVFSAYPPLYQGLLWLWMSLFGTTALSAVTLHLALFAAYAFVVFKILKHLQTPAWCFHIAGLFLLLLTFHDRPDSLAHLLGMLAIFFWIHSRKTFNNGNPVRRPALNLWLMVLCGVLTLCASLQIGGIYLVWLWVGMLSTTLSGREKFPLVPMAATLALPLAFVLFIKFCHPLLWAGFMEHARQTPALTGLRWPHTYELLKVARTAPGIFLVALLLPWSWFKQHNDVEHRHYARQEFVLLPALLSALAVVVACLFFLTANTVAIANYLQPVIVACYLGVCATMFAGQRWLRIQVACLLFAALLGSVRAAGMSTWGVLCARGNGYPASIQRIESELSAMPAGSKVVVSSAFLYEATKHTNLTLVHSDWMVPAKTVPDLQGLLALKPRKIILTQYDYYRRYEPVLRDARANATLQKVEITNTARVSPPDAIPSLQRVVQHVSWAPVIVNLSWRE